VWFPLPGSVSCSPSRRWVSLVPGKEYAGWSQLKPISLLEILLLLNFYTLYQAEPHIHSPSAGLANSGRHSGPFNELRRKHLHHQLILSADNNLLSTPKDTVLSPLCWDKVNIFASAVVCHTLCDVLSFIGTSPLAISTQPSSTVGVCGQ